MITARLTSALTSLQQTEAMRSIAKSIDALLEHDVQLYPALQAARHEIATSDAGKLLYYADTSASGRPLVLLHGVHAAASSYEMKPIFEYFRGERPVYALDLPGFGFSERSQRSYSPATYVHAIEHLLRNVSVKEPVDVVSLSLSCEYVAKVALEMPELVRSLVLISPTGFASEREMGFIERIGRQRRRLIDPALIEMPAARLLYELIVSRPSLRWFLNKSFERELDPGMLAYAFATSHQPGAWRAPMTFLAGSAFPRGEALNVYAHVHAPALVLYDRDNYTTFDQLAGFAESHHNYQLQRVEPTRGLPHFDAPERAIEHMREFFDELEQRRTRGAEVRVLHTSRFVGSA